MCNCTKRAFMSKSDAKRAARQTPGDCRGGYHKVGTLVAYRCPTEQGIWHVGHKAGTYRIRTAA